MKDRNRDTGGHLIKTIRLLKYVRDITWGFSAKSVIFTTLIGERVSTAVELIDPGCYADVPSTLRKVVADLDAWLQARPTLPPITDPGGTDDRFDARWDQAGYTTFREKIHALHAKIDQAYYETDKAKSIAAWQEVFGAGFVAPPTTISAASRNLIIARGKTVVATERFLDRDLGIPFRLNGHRLQIATRVKPKQGFRAYRLADNSNRVERQRDLVFEVTDCTVPHPYDIYWKVRNTGDDARDRGSLRGEIRRRGERITETTAYIGPHWVEAYVVRDGVCVARARQPVVIY